MVVVMKSACSMTLIIICMAMAAYNEAEAAISCARVSSKLTPCIPYVESGKTSTRPPAACCSGIKSLKDTAKTTPDRQAVCNCLKSIARAFPSGIVQGLPGKCGVNIPFKISPSTNCKSVK